MICTTIQNRDLEGILEELGHCEMAEIRLDRCSLDMEGIAECFSSDVPLVATCRVAEVMASDPSLNLIAAASLCERRLTAAIEAGASYVDVEIEAPKQMSKRVRQAAHENGAVFMRSYHDFSGTPSVGELEEIRSRCIYHGADMVKIVTTAVSEEDVARVMSLYAGCVRPGRDVRNGNAGKPESDGGLIAFCMGDAGRSSRLECLRMGAPFTYAAVSEDEAAAPGQWAADAMHRAVYGDFRLIGEKTFMMPASKSFAQRAIVAAALAGGESRLHGYTPCDDSEAAIGVARALGASVEVQPDVYGVLEDDTEGAIGDGERKCIVIRGISAVPGCLSLKSLNVGESGLLARLMIPVASQLSSSPVRFEGERTLTGRTMTGVPGILEKFGVSVAPGGDSCCVPLEVSGALKGGRAEISGKNGSQLISGLLMALPLGERGSTVIVSDPKSIPYMFITADVMRKFGVRVTNEMSGGRDFMESGGDWSLCSEITFRLKGGQRYRSADFALEGDWSAAVAFLVAGAVFGRVSLAGLDTTSLQADLTIMDVLMDAGASLSQTGGDRGVVSVQRAPLRAFSMDASHCPDLFPMLAVLAAFCRGTSRIAGTDRLAHKESDRAAAIHEMLEKMGVGCRIADNVMEIDGIPLVERLLSGKLLHGGSYSSCHDHRMVMALKVASLGADGPVCIDDEACVSKSFPRFLEYFGQL